jgi:ABC-type multidrug transport system permease subunit
MLRRLDLIEAMVTNGIGNQDIRCSSTELVTIPPPSGTTCQGYMANFINARGGYLVNPLDTSNCQFCSVSSSNSYLCVFVYTLDVSYR